MDGHNMKRSASTADAKAEDSTTHPKRQRAGESNAQTSNDRLACPFHRRNPQMYCATRKSKYFKSCASGGFKDTHRVKEHLLRRHMAPSQCDRCGTVFENAEECEVHQRAQWACQRTEPLFRVPGITAEQKTQLTRKTRTNDTEEQKWNTIYTILFPNEPIPSAYDMSPEEQAQVLRVCEANQLESYAKQRLHNLVDSALRAALSGSPSSSGSGSTISADAASLLALLPSALDASITQLHAEYRYAMSMVPDVATPLTSAHAGTERDTVSPRSMVVPTTKTTPAGTSGSSNNATKHTSPGMSPSPVDTEDKNRVDRDDGAGDGDGGLSNHLVWSFEEFDRRLRAPSSQQTHALGGMGLSLDFVGAGLNSDLPFELDTDLGFDYNPFLDNSMLFSPG